jgi:tetratricopeptide (TPR) repeat protein
MDQDILLELEQIRGVLNVIAILLGALAAFKLFNVIGNVANNWQLQRSDRIRNHSIDLYEQEKYAELEDYLSKKLTDYPNNATAVYWMARSHLGKAEYETAKKYFLKLRDLEPSWEQDYISPHMKEIEEKH